MLKHYPEGMTTGREAVLAAEAMDYAARTPATEVVMVGSTAVTITGDHPMPRGMVEAFVAEASALLEAPSLRYAA